MRNLEGRWKNVRAGLSLALVAAMIPALLSGPLRLPGRPQRPERSIPRGGAAIETRTATGQVPAVAAIGATPDRRPSPMIAPSLPPTGPAPLAPSDPSAGLPGYAAGGRPSTGTSFAFESPERTLRVTSATPVRLSLMADAMGLWMAIERESSEAHRTDLVVEGLEPGAAYQVVVDGLPTSLLAADAGGSAAFGQDLSLPHVVEVQLVVPPADDADSFGLLLFDGDTYNFTASMADTVIYVLGDDVTINGGGFTLSGDTISTGITMTGHSNLTIKNLKIESFARGLALAGSAGVNLTGVSFEKCDFGLVDLGWSSGLVLDSCQFTSNIRGMHMVNTASVVQSGSTYTTNTFPFEFYAGTGTSPVFELHSCTFTGNTYPPTARANSAADYAGFSWDTSNFTDGLPDFCFFAQNGTGSPIDSLNNTTNFMFLGGCINFTISNVTMTTGFGKVLMLDLCTLVTISSCTMTGVSYGILADRSTSVSVSGCTISNFKVGGVTFVGGGIGPIDGTIAGNTFSTIYGGPGITIVNFKIGASPEGVSVTGNTLTASQGWGILVSNASGNDIGSNSLTNTGGIRVEGGSNGNAFHHNTIQTSKWHGMKLAAGLLGYLPSGNRIIGNSFINNANPVWDDGYSTWDDGEGSGNYWSAWTGPDAALPVGVVDFPFLPPHGPSLNPDPVDHYPRTAAFPATVNPYTTTICNEAGDQSYPQIVPDGAGGVIVAWSDFRAGEWDIYAQRMDATGTPQWTAGGVAICIAAGDQSLGAIVPDDSGGAVIVWTDLRGGTTHDLYAQRVDSTGTTIWAADGEVVCKEPESQLSPLAIPDGSGGAIIAWQDERGGVGSDIYAQLMSSDGAPQWKDGGTEVCLADGDQRDPQICDNGSGGAVIVWTDTRVGNAALYGQRVDPTGASEWAKDGVSISSTGNSHYAPRIVTDGAGGAIVTWQDEGFISWHYDIYAQRVDQGGTTLWGVGDLPVCQSPGFEYAHQVASDHEGGAIIVWEDDRNGSADIYAQRIDANGAAMWADDGIAVCTDSAAQTNPQICWDGWGGAVIAWEDLRGADGDIYAQRLNGAGVNLWTYDGTAICSAAGVQSLVCLASDGLGRAVMAWEDSRNGEKDIFSRAVYARGTK